MREIRMFEAFAGYGSQLMAMRRLEEKYPDKIKVVPVGISEIDKYAIKAYHAAHGEDIKNYGDISKIDWSEVPDFDLLTYSSPCQDFSNAGKMRGGEEGSGTRSSLLWEVRRAIVEKRPKYLLMENVAALVGLKFIKTFNLWQAELESYGYTNFAQVLNAKDYGVPQNRERIFMVSILDCEQAFYFPEPMPLKLRLKDVLEEKVDESYYLSDKIIQGFNAHKERHEDKGNGFAWNPTEGEGVAACVLAGGGADQPITTLMNPIGGQIEPTNVDVDGNARCLRAGYYKAGQANFKERDDGFAQTAVKTYDKT